MLISLTDYISELTLFDNLEFLIRILLSGVLGTCIGLERSKRLKEAGIRTHCIIACTAATFMILSKYAFGDVGSGDPARLAAQVISGISFIGAGVIFQQNTGIKGLTTAAGMWATSAVGLAIGAGLYWVGLVEATVLLFIQVMLHRFRLGSEATELQEVAICMEDTPEMQQKIRALIDRHQGRIESSDISRDGNVLCLTYLVRLEEPISTEETMALLEENPGISRIAVS